MKSWTKIPDKSEGFNFLGCIVLLFQIQIFTCERGLIIN